MNCKYCEKESIDHSDMHSDDMCDDCFDLMLDQEEKDFEIYYNQDSKCFLCGENLSSWIRKNIEETDRVVCWPSCENKSSPAIIITINDLNLK